MELKGNLLTVDCMECKAIIQSMVLSDQQVEVLTVDITNLYDAFPNATIGELQNFGKTQCSDCDNLEIAIKAVITDIIIGAKTKVPDLEIPNAEDFIKDTPSEMYIKCFQLHKEFRPKVEEEIAIMKASGMKASGVIENDLIDFSKNVDYVKPANGNMNYTYATYIISIISNILYVYCGSETTVLKIIQEEYSFAFVENLNKTIATAHLMLQKALPNSYYVKLALRFANKVLEHRRHYDIANPDKE